jgi:nitrilase
METVIAAAVQAAPAFLDREACVERACRLIREAGSNGARLAVFPEAFVPTYPDWVWRSVPWQDQGALYRRLFENSVVIPSATTDALSEAARTAGMYVCMGVNERDERGSTLYNTLLYLGPDGSVLGKHRKLMPTGAERLVWGAGDGSTLLVLDTPFGRVGGLTCWEHYMPLARYAMYAQGVDILLAPTWDRGEVWTASLRHIAKEGRVFAVGVAPVLRGSDVPADIPGREGLYRGDDDWMCPGGSAIVGPAGQVLAGPLAEKEGILYAELDAAAARSSRHEFDPVGHYARPDVFRLTVDTRPRAPVVASGDGMPGSSGEHAYEGTLPRSSPDQPQSTASSSEDGN